MRAALLWTANPLLLQVLVAGAHADGLAVCFAVSALALFSVSLRYAPRATRHPTETLARGQLRGRWRQRPQRNVVVGVTAYIRSFLIAAGAGTLTGLAFGVKISLVLVPVGLVIAAALAAFPHDRPRWQPFAVVTTGLACGFAAIAAATLIPWETQPLGPALRAGSYVSIGSPWRPVRSALSLAMAETTANDLVRAGAVILAVILLGLFARPLTALDGLRADTFALIAAAVFAVVLAWLTAWTYVLPWYDSLLWALLAVLPWLPAPWAALDWLVLARTTVLAFAYLPARGIALPPGLGWTRTVVRSGVTPVLLLALIVFLVVALRPRRSDRNAA